MYQETGETRNAIMEDDARDVQNIINANTSRRGKYWIVIFAKPSKHSMEGKPVLIKHIKAYGMKPKPQVGMMVGEVDNSKGTLEWDVNMPQRPFAFDKLPGGQEIAGGELVVETNSIPDAYITK